MAPLSYAAKLDPFLSLDCATHALHPGAIQGKEGIQFCHLATLPGVLGAERLHLRVLDDAAVVHVGVVPLEHGVAVHVRLGLVAQAALRQLLGVLQ